MVHMSWEFYNPGNTIKNISSLLTHFLGRFICVVLRFYGPVNILGSCQAGQFT